MISVTVRGEEISVPEGTTYLDLAGRYQPEYPHDIVLVRVDRKLQELAHEVTRPCSMEFVTTADPAGISSYERSMVLLMNKAIYDVFSLDQVEKVLVKFSVTHGLYVETFGDLRMDEEALALVKARMNEMIAADIPIEKRSVPVDEAIQFFHGVMMYDKERLLRYRRSSLVNLYSIEGFADYHYGYMVPSTGYLCYYDLKPYQDGFVLLLPTRKEPEFVPEFVPQDKLFSVCQSSSRWCEKLQLDTVGEVNDWIAGGRLQEMILISEAHQEKEINAIAGQIASSPDKKFIMIAGPSSSGKTSFSHRLSIQLMEQGLTPHPIAVDDYFVDREQTPLDENGDYDFETLACVDVEQFNRDMQDLLAGKEVAMPTFNFEQGKKEYHKGNVLRLGPSDILVIEGIHCLNDALSYTLPKESKFKIYISALTQINVDEHDRIPTTDGRLLRRIVRDARTRGTTARETIARWPSVRRGEERNIFPYQETADVIFNSTLVYEFSVLKSYAEALLYGIPSDAPEFEEAKRLLKFLDYFLAVDSTAVPQNSLLKEFVGGSCFRV